MKEKRLNKIVQKIRKLVYHVGIFEQNISKIVKGASPYTRAYLVVLLDALPDIKDLIRFASKTVPAIDQMTGAADRGVTNINKASEILLEIRRSTENAVNEIFAGLDRVDPLLDKVAEKDGMDEDIAEALSQVREQLMRVLNALQFQDITSQQIDATNALLADLGKSLLEFADGKGTDLDVIQIEVKEGTFDANASFNRDSNANGQQMADEIFSEEALQEVATGDG